MSRIAYVNGRYLPHRSAAVHIEDRGYQFADGVYEVIPVKSGHLIDEAPHLARLARSLGELRIRQPVSESVLRHILRRVLARNRVRDGLLYLQVTRGAAPRDHAFPVGVDPVLVVTARRAKPVDPGVAAQGIAVVTIADERWARRDIKSISLLPNVLGKQAARERGAAEAWQVEASGVVTEGTSSNAWIVARDGSLITQPAGPQILNGVTRLAVIEVAREHQIRVNERPFTVAEALAAPEAFISSSSGMVLAVVRLDDQPIGDGRPGPVVTRLREALEARISEAARR